MVLYNQQVNKVYRAYRSWMARKGLGQMKNLFSEEMLIIILLIFITIIAIGFSVFAGVGMFELIKTIKTLGGMI